MMRQSTSAATDLSDQIIPNMNFMSLLSAVSKKTVRLDKFWHMIYDFQAELHGTGSRSLHSN